ncbi:MAG: alpha/beta fold hydrolase [Bacteroidota bacterium]
MSRHLIFLHGALGCNSHWERFLPAFENSFTIHNLNFPGHGNSDITLDTYSLQALSDTVQQYIQSNNIQAYAIIGYSLGGYVGLQMLADKVQGLTTLITLATKLNWNQAIADEECSKVTLENLAPIHEKLRTEHHQHFDTIVATTRDIMQSIGKHPLSTSDFSDNTIPVHMLLGSKDKMVTVAETLAFAEKCPSFSTSIIEEQPHSLERMNADAVGAACNEFLIRAI